MGDQRAETVVRRGALVNRIADLHCVVVYRLRADSIAKASSEAVYRKVTRYLGQLTGEDKDQQLTLDHL